MVAFGQFLEVFISGLLAGVLYSLVALGFVLIFKASGVFNFAQGAMVLLAGLALVRSLDLLAANGFPMWAAIVVGFLFAAVIMAITAWIVERFVLPPAAEEQLPDSDAEALAYAAEHPDREEVRIVAGATRAGSTYCALRMRSHDDDLKVLEAPDLVPSLLELLLGTFQPDSAVPEND